MGAGGKVGDPWDMVQGALLQVSHASYEDGTSVNSIASAHIAPSFIAFWDTTLCFCIVRRLSLHFKLL